MDEILIPALFYDKFFVFLRNFAYVSYLKAKLLKMAKVKNVVFIIWLIMQDQPNLNISEAN